MKQADQLRNCLCLAENTIQHKYTTSPYPTPKHIKMILLVIFIFYPTPQYFLKNNIICESIIFTLVSYLNSFMH